MESTATQASIEDDSEIGSRLRRAREESGRSIQEIAAELPLRPKILEALENDDFDNLPAPIFVRGYLRTYARQLDISPDPLLEAYERHSFPPPKLETSTPLSQSIQPSETLFRTLTHVGVAGLIVLVMLWWQSRTPDGFDFQLTDSGDSTRSVDSESGSRGDIPNDFSFSSSATESVSNTTERAIDDEGNFPIGDSTDDTGGFASQESLDDTTALAAAAPASTFEIAIEDDQGTESSPTSEDGDGSSATGDQGEPRASDDTDEDSIADGIADESPGESSSASSPSPQATISPGGPSRLTIRLRHESWIEVYDRNGERLMFELADADREISLVGDSPFDVLLGNAKDVEVQFNDVPFDYGPHTLNGIARFRLER
ncbi:RodZ domain-containing protein [Thioalkalivibrio sp. HK1]|uniref:RodZ domain-containing protein n=1 Tax=Thioalkalivibrio sp. HK1 TaxID=1469245 RepID=UPI0004721525|nr:RodZ domain-containing protein [Thioalkalivibrio sp. HK1]